MSKKYLLFCFLGISISISPGPVELHLFKQAYHNFRATLARERTSQIKIDALQNSLRLEEDPQAITGLREEIEQNLQENSGIQELKKQWAASVAQRYWQGHHKEGKIFCVFKQDLLWKLRLILSFSRNRPKSFEVELSSTKMEFDTLPVEVTVFQFEMSFDQDMPKIPDNFNEVDLMSIYIQAMRTFYAEFGKPIIGVFTPIIVDQKSVKETVNLLEMNMKFMTSEQKKELLAEIDLKEGDIEKVTESFSKCDPARSEEEHMGNRAKYSFLSTSINELFKNLDKKIFLPLGCIRNSICLSPANPNGILNLFEREVILPQILLYEKCLSELRIV